MKKTNKKGFTIVELVIVIAVIAILAGVLIPTFTSVIDKANLSKATQAGRNAYTVALAEALDTDGNAKDQTVKLTSTLEVTTGTADWTITFSDEAGTTTTTFTSTTYSGYTFTVTSGVYSCTKNS